MRTAQKKKSNHCLNFTFIDFARMLSSASHNLWLTEIQPKRSLYVIRHGRVESQIPEHYTHMNYKQKGQYASILNESVAQQVFQCCILIIGSLLAVDGMLGEGTLCMTLRRFLLVTHISMLKALILGVSPLINHTYQ